MTWPPRPGNSVLEAFFRTWRLSVFEPTAFFRALPSPRPVGPAILYYLLVGVPAVGIALFWQSLFALAMDAFGLVHSDVEPMGLDAWWPVVNFLLSPIFLLLGLGISFVITHLLLLIFGGARRGAGTTMRVLCFAYGPALFGVVPVIGSLVGGIWSIVLAIIGLREGHQTDGWRAATAVLLPIVVIIFLCIAALILIGVLATYFNMSL